jgi:hypothetical protein
MGPLRSPSGLWLRNLTPIGQQSFLPSHNLRLLLPLFVREGNAASRSLAPFSLEWQYEAHDVNLFKRISPSPKKKGHMIAMIVILAIAFMCFCRVIL